MNDDIQQEIIHLSGVLVIPDSMPECLRILDTSSKPILNRYLIKKGGIVFQGVTENVIEYVYLCPIQKVEKNKTLKCRINFARYIENEKLNDYSKISLKADLAWKEFSLINTRHIRFFQIIHVNPCYTFK